MESTRNINMCGDYNLEQRENNNILNYYLFEDNKKYENDFPDFGINSGLKGKSIVSHNDYFHIIRRPIRNKSPVQKTPRKINNFVKFFQKDNVIIPEPLVIQHNQRPKLS